VLLCRSCAHFPCVYSLPPSNYAHDFIILFFVRICCLNGKQMWPHRQQQQKENRNRIWRCFFFFPLYSFCFIDLRRSFSCIKSQGYMIVVCVVLFHGWQMTTTRAMWHAL
jgi:hypothetical protein